MTIRTELNTLKDNIGHVAKPQLRDHPLVALWIEKFKTPVPQAEIVKVEIVDDGLNTDNIALRLQYRVGEKYSSALRVEIPACVLNAADPLVAAKAITDEVGESEEEKKSIAHRKMMLSIAVEEMPKE